MDLHATLWLALLTGFAFVETSIAVPKANGQTSSTEIGIAGHKAPDLDVTQWIGLAGGKKSFGHFPSKGWVLPRRAKAEK